MAGGSYAAPSLRFELLSGEIDREGLMAGIEETYGSQVQGLLVTLSIILDAVLSIEFMKDSMQLPKFLN